MSALALRKAASKLRTEEEAKAKAELEAKEAAVRQAAEEEARYNKHLSKRLAGTKISNLDSTRRHARLC